MTTRKVDIKLLPVKAHYFFYFGGISALWPFVNVFAKQLGISSMGVGLIFGAAPLAGLTAKPLFGAIADRFKKKKITFLFFILLNLMSYSCIAFLPQKKPERPVTLDCTDIQTYIKQCGPSNAHCNESIIESFNKIQNRNQPPSPILNNTSYSTSGIPSTVSRASPNSDHTGSTATTSTEEGHPFGSGNSRIGIEHCNVECYIYTYEEGFKFCSSIQGNNAPSSMCDHSVGKDKRNLSNQQQEQSMDAEASSTENDNGETEYYGDYGVEHAHPTILNFSVNIKMWDITFLENSDNNNKNCLNLPVETVTFASENEKVVGLYCDPRATLSYCFIHCPNNDALNLHMERILEDYDIYDSVNFWLYGTLVIFAFVAMAVVCSIGDALCFQILGDKPENYGAQRQYGAIGWGMFALISGYLIDTYSAGKLLKDYTPAFYMVAGLLILDLAVSYKWDIKELEKPKSLRRNVSTLLTDLRIIVFIAACIIVGMCTGLQWNFLMWYVEDLASSVTGETCDVHDNHIKTLQGLINAVQCFLGEVPFFHFSGWFIKKFGHVHCITMVLGVFGLRFIIYSLLVNPWTILPVEILQGLTFGVFYATMTSYANEISPTGSSATVQGLVGSAFEGLGVAAGSLVGGLMFHSYGGRRAFLIFGCGSLVFCFLHLVVMLVLQRDKNYRGVPLGIRNPEGQEMRQITASNLDVDSE